MVGQNGLTSDFTDFHMFLPIFRIKYSRSGEGTHSNTAQDVVFIAFPIICIFLENLPSYYILIIGEKELIVDHKLCY